MLPPKTLYMDSQHYSYLHRLPIPVLYYSFGVLSRNALIIHEPQSNLRYNLSRRMLFGCSTEESAELLSLGCRC